MRVETQNQKKRTKYSIKVNKNFIHSKKWNFQNSWNEIKSWESGADRDCIKLKSSSKNKLIKKKNQILDKSENFIQKNGTAKTEIKFWEPQKNGIAKVVETEIKSWEFGTNRDYIKLKNRSSSKNKLIKKKHPETFK